MISSVRMSRFTWENSMLKPAERVWGGWNSRVSHVVPLPITFGLVNTGKRLRQTSEFYSRVPVQKKVKVCEWSFLSALVCLSWCASIRLYPGHYRITRVIPSSVNLPVTAVSLRSRVDITKQFAYLQCKLCMWENLQCKYRASQDLVFGTLALKKPIGIMWLFNGSRF